MSLRVGVPFVLLISSFLGVGLVLTALASENFEPHAVISVTSTADNLTSGDGQCTLREAIHNANADADTTGGDCAAGSGDDTINLPAGTYTITLAGAGEDANATGDFDVTSNLVIQGAGAPSTILNANQLDRVIHVLPGTTVEIKDLAVSGGRVVDAHGGGVANEGGSVTISGSLVSTNEVVGSAVVGGAGVANLGLSADASLVISNSQVISNTSFTGSGGGVRSVADSIYTATLIVSGSTISGNISHGSGAGILAGFMGAPTDTGRSLMTLELSLVDNNEAVGGNGGGVAVFGAPANSLATIADSTLSNNVADGSLPNGGVGGGLFSIGKVLFLRSMATGNQATRSTAGALGSGGGLANQGPVTIADSTINGNRATGSGELLAGIGGAIASIDVLTLTNSTVTSNTAAVTGGGIASATFVNPAITVSENTIVAGNSAPSDSNCSNYLNSALLISNGYNLEDANTCMFNQATDRINTDPKLGPLQDNGGPTWTQALLVGSPAVDQGSCPGATTDQRGFSRPVDLPSIPNAPSGDGCDIGAYEVQEVISGLSASNDGPTVLGQPTAFTATVTAGTGISYTWVFGDGSGGSGPNPSHTYAAVGLYTATVTATNSAGSATATTAVTVDEAISGLSASNDGPTVLGQPTAFMATVTAGTSVSYAWDFGDGSGGSGPNPSHTYPDPGVYTATVTASNSVGSAMATTTVTVEKWFVYIPVVFRLPPSAEAAVLQDVESEG